MEQAKRNVIGEIRCAGQTPAKQQFKQVADFCSVPIFSHAFGVEEFEYHN